MYSISQHQQSEDNKDKNSAVSKWLMFFDLSLLPSDEVGTAFAKEIMSTVPVDDRCRKFTDYIVDDSGCDFALDLYPSSPQQSPTTTNAVRKLHNYSFHRAAWNADAV